MLAEIYQKFKGKKLYKNDLFKQKSADFEIYFIDYGVKL